MNFIFSEMLQMLKNASFFFCKILKKHSPKLSKIFFKRHNSVENVWFFINFRTQQLFLEIFLSKFELVLRLKTIFSMDFLLYICFDLTPVKFWTELNSWTDWNCTGMVKLRDQKILILLPEQNFSMESVLIFQFRFKFNFSATFWSNLSI